MQGNFRWSQGGKCPPRPPLAPPLLTTIEKTKTKTKPIKDQTSVENQREKDVGRFGFLDSAISLYVGQVDGSGDLMECVVRKWWLRERIVGRVLKERGG